MYVSMSLFACYCIHIHSSIIFADGTRDVGALNESRRLEIYVNQTSPLIISAACEYSSRKEWI